MKTNGMKALERVGCSPVKASLAYVRAVLTGKLRQENEHLVQRLAALRADYNRLKRDTDELLNYADKELKALRHTNTEFAKEFDDLQLRIWELEQQVDELLLYIAKLAGSEGTAIKTRVEDEIEAIPNLSYLSLGIVGGHETTVREVVNELAMIYGLQRWVVVPPTWEASLKKSVLKGKLKRCDLVVIVTGYMNHSLTEAVMGLKASGGIPGKVVLLNFRGKSGIMREVLRQVKLLDAEGSEKSLGPLI